MGITWHVRTKAPVLWTFLFAHSVCQGPGWGHPGSSTSRMSLKPCSPWGEDRHSRSLSPPWPTACIGWGRDRTGNHHACLWQGAGEVSLGILVPLVSAENTGAFQSDPSSSCVNTCPLGEGVMPSGHTSHGQGRWSGSSGPVQEACLLVHPLVCKALVLAESLCPHAPRRAAERTRADAGVSGLLSPRPGLSLSAPLTHPHRWSPPPAPPASVSCRVCV